MKQKYMVMVALWVTILLSVTSAYSTNLLNNNAYSLDSVLYTSSDMIDRVVQFPDFVQTATRFDARSINSKTARYFSFSKNTVINNYNTEFPCIALRNGGNIMVRISGINAITFNHPTSNAANCTVYSMYKNSNIPGTSFVSVDPSSVIQRGFPSVFAFSGGTLVFETYSTFDNVVGTGGSKVSINIPKELYSVVIEPGETLTLTAVCLRPGAVTSQFFTRVRITVDWEEIIN